MDKIFINQLNQYMDQDIVSYFLVAVKDVREGKKDYYIRLELIDKTGTVNANIWNQALLYADKFTEGQVVKIKAMVKNYKGQTQLSVTNIRTAEAEEFDLVDYVATSDKDIPKLCDEFYAFIDNIQNIYIKQLLLSIFEQNGTFFARFINSPAAKSWHHNYLGGLLEHTVSVARICEFSSSNYDVDHDLLIAGALLHDMGKVFEYNTKTMIDFTDEGRLVGHICIADQLVVEKAKEIDQFPTKTLMKLRHMILSHHGEYEKGAARIPQTIEAVVLHYADNLDAQTIGVQQLIKNADANQSEWTEFDKLNNRYIYIG